MVWTVFSTQGSIHSSCLVCGLLRLENVFLGRFVLLMNEPLKNERTCISFCIVLMKITALKDIISQSLDFDCLF